MAEFFADVLEEYIQRQGLSSGRLSTLSSIPKQTIQSWREGRVKRPRHIDPILQIARALHLNVVDTDALLMAARHPSMAKIEEKAKTGNDETMMALLSHWQTDTPERETTVSITQSKQKSPFQALSRIHDFVGRAAEVDAISADLKTNGTICILQGMGGVGKSTLANHLAYHLHEHFVDGILWGTLSGGVEREQRMMSLLRDFANAYGVDVTETTTVEGRSRIVRQLLSSKKALIILDGVLGTEDVRHILPPSTAMCSVLITTRNRKMLTDKARIYCINSFSQTDSQSMLGNIISRERIIEERASAIKIINFVGGLPLALRVIGSAIAEAQMVTLEEYSTLLQNERSRLEHLIDWEDVSQNVRASFELSYSRLNPKQQVIYSQLALFAGQNFRAEAVAALTHSPVPIVKISLGRFRSLSLLEFGKADSSEEKQHNQSGYYFHPLLHTFANEKVGEPDPELQKRLVVYYANFLEQSDVTYTEIDEEWENIQAAISWTDKHGWDDLFHQLLTSLTKPNLGLMGFLDVRGYWREGVRWFDQLLQTTLGQRNDLSTAFCYLKKGVFSSHLSDLQTAQNALLQSYTIIENPNSEQEAICYGYTCEQLSRVTTADGVTAMLSWSKKGVEQLEQFDTAAIKHLRGYLLARQAGIWARVGNIDSAYNTVQEGVTLLPDHPTAARIGAYTNLGVLATYQENYVEAQKYWQSAIADAEKMGDARRIVNLWQNLGTSSRYQGNLSEALNHYNNVIEHARRIGVIRLECIALSNSADLLMIIGQREEAAEKLLSAIALAQQWDAYIEEVRARLRYITYLLDTGSDAVQDEVTRCEHLIEQYDLIESQGDLLIVKANIALFNKQYIEANHLIEETLEHQFLLPRKGKALQTKGKILAALNQFDTAMNAFMESKKVLQNSDRVQYVNTQFEIAKLHHQQDKTIDIQPQLQQLLTEYQKLGVLPKVDEVQQLIDRLS